MDVFNKKKVIDLQKNIEGCKTTILRMSQDLAYYKEENRKLKEENSNLKFTLKHQRTY
jgi:regulator of replication initiation timing